MDLDPPAGPLRLYLTGLETKIRNYEAQALLLKQKILDRVLRRKIRWRSDVCY